MAAVALTWNRIAPALRPLTREESAAQHRHDDVRLHRCVAQKDSDSGLRIGDFTGIWMVAISTLVGPPDNRAKWLGVYKSAVDTARLGQKHTYVECFPLLGSFNTFCALLHIT